MGVTIKQLYSFLLSCHHSIVITQAAEGWTQTRRRQFTCRKQCWFILFIYLWGEGNGEGVKVLVEGVMQGHLPVSVLGSSLSAPVISDIKHGDISHLSVLLRASYIVPASAGGWIAAAPFINHQPCVLLPPCLAATHCQAVQNICSAETELSVQHLSGSHVRSTSVFVCACCMLAVTVLPPQLWAYCPWMQGP